MNIVVHCRWLSRCLLSCHEPGTQGRRLYLDKFDYKSLIELLQETSEAWNIRIVTYCLMPNHYYMLVHTPEGNISRAMRHVNGAYNLEKNSSVNSIIERMKTRIQNSRKLKMCIKKMED